jgi:SAM-dependent methyltransferase
MLQLFKSRSVTKAAGQARQGYVDVLTAQQISGWAADRARPNEPVFLDVSVNDEFVARLRARVFRSDLVEHGIGDGRKGFWFNPFCYLRVGANRVRVSFSDTGETVANGEQTVTHLTSVGAFAEASDAELLARSQERWKGDEHDNRLTWGSIMTGDSFIDVVCKYHTFTGEESLLEVGPGYGRLLATLLERRLPFGSYLGLELSDARVQKLTEQFSFPHIRFVTADILQDAQDYTADVVLCSSTFEHLFPSMLEALQNLHRMSRIGTKLFIDFILPEEDPHLSTSHAYFEYTSAYIRIYSLLEIETLFAEAGFRVLEVENIVLGQTPTGKDVRRALVTADRYD